MLEVYSVMMPNQFPFPWQQGLFPLATTGDVYSHIKQSKIEHDPHHWTKDDVILWLKKCARNYAIDEISPEKFNMNGYALCMLTKEDFLTRSPHGDLLYNTLQETLKNLQEVQGLTPNSAHSPLSSMPPRHIFRPPELLSPPLRLPSSPNSPMLAQRGIIHNTLISPPIRQNSDKPPALYIPLRRHSSSSIHSPGIDLSCRRSPLALSPGQRSDYGPGDGDLRDRNIELDLQVQHIRESKRSPNFDPRGQSDHLDHFQPGPGSHIYQQLHSPPNSIRGLHIAEHGPSATRDLHIAEQGHSAWRIIKGNSPQHSPSSSPNWKKRFDMYPLIAPTPTGSNETFDRNSYEVKRKGYDVPYGPCEFKSRDSNSSQQNLELEAPGDLIIDDMRSTHQIAPGVSLSQADVELFQRLIHDKKLLEPLKGVECKLLWEFLSIMLDRPDLYHEFVVWEDKSDLTFRIINPTGLGFLWGIQKNRTTMTYEKLSRALRYYYKMGIIQKVPQKRLTYKFLKKPSEIVKGQRGAKPYAQRLKLLRQQNAAANQTGPSENSENIKQEESEQDIETETGGSVSDPELSSNSSTSISENDALKSGLINTDEISEPMDYSLTESSRYQKQSVIVAGPQRSNKKTFPSPFLMDTDIDHHTHNDRHKRNANVETNQKCVTSSTHDRDNEMENADSDEVFLNGHNSLTIDESKNELRPSVTSSNFEGASSESEPEI
ncbi:unnamed protein product [Owenia fusiformis]|uniref:Uncharacterized protein n=1 Tax=Owenia fusiformis TaxID=6347 RepID=A0A8S4P0H1_OWEFU|nr:unnamed protein product [Owenia fusiformis]